MKQITLSEGEWNIMKLLWQKEPMTLGEIVSALQNNTGWSKATVFVMLKRMIQKGAVRMEEGGRYQQYYPCVSHKDAATEETASFLSRVYDGSISMLLSSVAGQKQLSQEEINALRRILDDAEKTGKD